MNIPLNVGKPSIRASENNPPSGRQQALEWRPIVDEGNRLSFSGTSFNATRTALSGVFGPFPIRLKKEHLPSLHAMMAVAKANGDGHKPYEQLAAALNRWGDLEIGEL